MGVIYRISSLYRLFSRVVASCINMINNSVYGWTTALFLQSMVYSRWDRAMWASWLLAKQKILPPNLL